MMLLSATEVSFKTSAPFRLTGTVDTKLLTNTCVQGETKASYRESHTPQTRPTYLATFVDPQLCVPVTSAGYLHLEVTGMVSGNQSFMTEILTCTSCKLTFLAPFRTS